MADRIFYSDLDLGLGTTQQGDLLAVTNQDSVAQRIYTVLNTRPGSRVMRPLYGCNLQRYLFAQFDEITATSMGEQVVDSLTQNVPEAVILNVRVNMVQDTQSYEITVTYRMTNSSVVDNVSLVLKKS